MKSLSIAPSTTTGRHARPSGRVARQRLREGAQPCFAPAKAEKPAPPRRLAVAPVNRIVPRPRGAMRRAASRPVKKPAKQAISHTFKYTCARPPRIEKFTLAPMWKARTSTGPTLALDPLEHSDDLLLLAGIHPNAWALPPAARGGFDLLHRRRPACRRSRRTQTGDEAPRARSGAPPPSRGRPRRRSPGRPPSLHSFAHPEPAPLPTASCLRPHARRGRKRPRQDEDSIACQSVAGMEAGPADLLYTGG